MSYPIISPQVQAQRDAEGRRVVAEADPNIGVPAPPEIASGGANDLAALNSAINHEKSVGNVKGVGVLNAELASKTDKTALPAGFVLDDAPKSALPPGFTLDPAPSPAPQKETPAPSNFDVFRNAAYKGAAGLPDMVLNAPNKVLNLGRAALGSVETLAGRPDLAPELKDDPDLATKALEKIGLIKPNVNPKGAAQKAIDVLTQGAVGGALTGGASLPRTIAGAGMGALSSGSQAGVDALTGNRALGAAAGMLGPRAIAGRGNIRPDVQRLAKEGVSMTPGQIKGGGWERTEEALTSVPFLGDAIKDAQRRGHESFNVAAANRALAPVGEKMPKGVVGNDAIAYVQDKLGSKYDALLSNLKGTVDHPLALDLGNISQKGSVLPPEKQTELNDIIQHEVVGEIRKHNGSGRSLKNIESKLGGLQATYAKSENYHTRELAERVGDIQESIRDMLARVNPDHAAELADINKGYAQFKRIQRAGSSVAAKDGVFTPAQLHASVKAGDNSKDKSKFARGDALSQGFSGAGKNVLSQKLPESGTAPRALVTALGAMGAGGFGAEHVGQPGFGAAAMGLAGAGAGGMVLYSKPVQAMIQKYMLSDNPRLREAATRSIIPQAEQADKR